MEDSTDGHHKPRFPFLLSGRRDLYDSRAATIGRQQLFLDESDLTTAGLDGINPTGFVDDLRRRFAAKRVDFIDASDYEETTILHDMNQPIDPALHKQ